MRGQVSADRQFELRVFPDGESAYGLALFQCRVGQAKRTHHQDAADQDAMTRIVQLWGDPLRAVMDQVLVCVKRAGYRATDLQRSRKAPFQLPEEEAVRLGLLFLAVKPLRKLGRIESIADHLKRMEPEEAYYWYSKVTGTGSARRAQRALRVLMAEE